MLQYCTSHMRFTGDHKNQIHQFNETNVYFNQKYSANVWVNTLTAVASFFFFLFFLRIRNKCVYIYRNVFGWKWDVKKHSHTVERLSLWNEFWVWIKALCFKPYLSSTDTPNIVSPICNNMHMLHYSTFCSVVLFSRMNPIFSLMQLQ